MRSFRVGIIFLLSIVISACEFKQSVNKDLVTGAYSRGDGLGCGQVYIEIDGKPDNRNTFLFGEHVAIVFNNITGLKQVDNLTFPSMSINIVKNEKDTVLSEMNLLPELKNGTSLMPLKLQADFTAALPHRNDEQYQLYIKITDEKGDGTFTYELPFTINPSDLLEIHTYDMDYSNIYLWNNTTKFPVYENKVSPKDTLILIMEGVEGLTEKLDRVYPICSIHLVDGEGNEIISNPNALKVHEDSGIDKDEFATSQIPVRLTFSSGVINNPYQLTVHLADRNSSRKITVETVLELE